MISMAIKVAEDRVRVVQFPNTEEGADLFVDFSRSLGKRVKWFYVIETVECLGINKARPAQRAKKTGKKRKTKASR